MGIMTKTKPKLGQNFLNDGQAVERIANALGDLTGRTVIEVGPGRGAITHALAARAAHVVAVELDPVMAERLRAEFPADRVSVVNQDVLQFDFAGASKAAGERLAVFGNLPYGITSPILTRLAAQSPALDCAVLMVQREVADRVAAAPGSRDYGVLSISVQLHGPVEKLLTLSPTAFSPPPEVYSTVFRWRFKPRFAELGVEETGFLRFVRQCFAQKRKTLANNLRAAGMAAPEVSAALEEAEIEGQARAESLSIERLARLWRILELRGATSTGEIAPESETRS